MSLALVEKAPIVEIKELSKAFDKNLVLKDINLEIPEGKIIGLLGPNGAGKSTLLKILAAFQTNYEGEVKIDGLRPGAKTKARVAYLPDEGGLPAKMSVDEMMDYYETFFDDFDRERCKELLAQFDIKGEDTQSTMSRGMADKLKIALLMARHARLYLLDEPIGGVDIEARDVVMNSIIEDFNPHSSIIIVTHSIQDIESLFDEIIVLRDGNVVAYENCDKLRETSDASLGTIVKELFRGGSI